MPEHRSDVAHLFHVEFLPCIIAMTRDVLHPLMNPLPIRNNRIQYYLWLPSIASIPKMVLASIFHRNVPALFSWPQNNRLTDSVKHYFWLFLACAFRFFDHASLPFFRLLSAFRLLVFIPNNRMAALIVSSSVMALSN